MKKILFLAFILAIMLGCGTEPKNEGRIIIEGFDSPPPPNVEHIYITLTEISVHSDEMGWETLMDTTVTFDFLELINGTTAVMADTVLAPGSYQQLRLVVADSNQIVVDGVTYPLKIPSGSQSGIKINLNFTIEEDEIIEIMVDFDASKSITWTPGNYILRPTFKAFKKVLSGTISGNVMEAERAAIPNALIQAINGSDTTSTLTDVDGNYKLILPAGTYDMIASAEGYTVDDTSYTDVELNAEDELVDYNFILFNE